MHKQLLFIVLTISTTQLTAMDTKKYQACIRYENYSNKPNPKLKDRLKKTLIISSIAIPQENLNDLTTIKIRPGRKQPLISLQDLTGRIDELSITGYDFSTGIPPKLDELLKNKNLEIGILNLRDNNLKKAAWYHCEELHFS
jgi:hypothetical protein